MKLSVYERLVLLNILPSQGSLTDLRVLRDLQRGLSFSEEELAALDFQHEDTQVKWNKQAAVDVEIEIGPRAREIIRSTFEQLSDKQMLQAAHLEIAERFMEPALVKEVA